MFSFFLFFSLCPRSERASPPDSAFFSPFCGRINMKYLQCTLRRLPTVMRRVYAWEHLCLSLCVHAQKKEAARACLSCCVALIIVSQTSNVRH